MYGFNLGRKISGDFLEKKNPRISGEGVLMQGYMIEGFRLYQSTMSQLTSPLDCGAKIQPLFGSEKFNKNCIND